MKMLSPEEIAIRLATTEALDIAGRKQAAALLETNPARISRLENTDNTENAAAERLYLKASEAVRLDLLAGFPYIIGAMAKAQGFELRKLEQGVAEEGMSRHLAAIAKEVGELLSEMADAASDNRTTVAEAHRIYGCLTDVFARLRDAMSECERVIAGDAKVSLRAV